MSVMLYKTPGPHKYDLGMFDQMTVPESQVKECLEGGWFKTMQEAIGKKEVVDPPKPPKSTASEAIAASRKRRK